MGNFRSIEFWKTSIMTLPENAFFELLRTVFGKIKTPFSKQILMGDLERFLLRDDIINNIKHYINDNDRLVIAAVAALNEPTPGDLEAFFTGEIGYAKLHDLVVNLEERFILYRFFEEGQNKRISRLALNPVLEPVLSPIAAESSLLFPTITANEAADEKKQGGLLNDRILAALLSFVSRNRLFFRAGGGIRQKVSNAAKTLFPGLPLETIMDGLRVLGLFFDEGETLVPDYHRFAAFGNLSRIERMAYCAAGILSKEDASREGASETFSPWMYRAKVRNYAETISRLHNLMDSERLYPHATLRKLAFMGESGGDSANSDNIIDAMEKTGLIIRHDAAGCHEMTAWRKALLTEPAPSKEGSASTSPAIAMDTPATLIVYPEIAYNDAVSIAAFADIIEAGMTVRFELSRDSVVLAFNRGYSAEQIIELLQRLSHNRIDENVLFTLRDWEKRHGEVTLRRGLVLTLAPQQQHLAETKPLAKLIVETLAPGVYMLPEAAEESAVQALSRAGVSIIARRDLCRSEEPASDTLRHFFQPLLAAPSPSRAAPSADSANDGAASILINKFHSILKQMPLTGETRDELAARIDRRLVLCESQLKDAIVRYEKLEARGLDYVGKALIAKQAVAMQSPVELVLPGKQDHVFGIPKALDKAGNESILVLELLNEGDDGIDNTMRIPLGKISLLRRIKKSIFEG